MRVVPSGGVVMFPRYLTAMTWLVAFLCATAWSADDRSVLLFVTATGGNGPLVVEGARLPQTSGDPPTFVVRNVSSKEVRYFNLTPLGGTPARSTGSRDLAGVDGKGERRNGDGTFWPRGSDWTFPPGRSLETGPQWAPGFTTRNLLDMARRVHTTCMHVAAIVSYVEFTDGTTWGLTDDQMFDIWKHSVRPESIASCRSSTRSDDQTSQIVTGFRAGIPTQLGREKVRQYSLVCPIREVNGADLAMCEW